jgi:hypothetical protein
MARRQSAVTTNNLTARVPPRRDAAKPRDETGSPSRQRSVPDGDAKVLIKTFFESRHGTAVYASDIADELHFEYDRALRLIEELETDGKIARV